MKLGLIAMSGVRAHNKELNTLGLTLPGFADRNKTIASLPSLGLLTLAGQTPKDIDLHYLEIADLSEIEDLPGEFDAVAISSFTAQIKDAYRLADRYRKQGTKVILGGLHVSVLPDEALKHADSIIIGEGEILWPALIEDLKNKNIKKIYDARGQSFDLAKAPMPLFELLDMPHYNRITVQTQRGCPFSCEFCASSIRLSPKFKIKPIDKIIAEIQRIKSHWHAPFIEFADDNTFANKAHGKRLLHKIIPEKVRWFTETDISVAEDEELLALLRDSGCAQLLIGFEFPTQDHLEGIETKSNWKARQVDTYLTAIEKIQSYGVSVNGCFILGLDGTDEDSFQTVFDFVKQSKLYEVQVTIQTAFPGTPLYTKLQKEGRLLRKDAWETCTLFDVNFKPTHMTVEQLEDNFRNLVEKLYSDDFTKRRRSKFRKTLSLN